MAKLITNQLKSFLINETATSNSTFFIVLGKHTTFPNDTTPPTPINSTNDTTISLYDNAIAGKVVVPYNSASPNSSTSDVQFMIPRVDWTSNTGYAAYRHTSENVGYVGVQGPISYDVFKCLGNNDGLTQVRSMYPPALPATSPSDDVYVTADGYQWKYMYSVPNATFSKFATQNYVPVFHNTDVRTYANPGGIEYIEVGYAGSNYNATTGGTIQSASVGGNTLLHQIETTPGSPYFDASSISNFYVGSAIKITQGPGVGEMRTITTYTVTGAIRLVGIDSPFSTTPTTISKYEISPKVVIVGDGTGFQGRALVNTQSSNTVYAIEVVSVGSGYRHATATLQGNTSGTSNAAQLSVIISPVNGHGYDPIAELGGTALCFTTNIDATNVTANTKTLATNDFRTISVLRSPKLANVVLNITSLLNTFSIGETVTQATTGATGVVVARSSTALTLTSASINFLPSYAVTGASSGATASVVTTNNNGSINLTANVDYVNMTTRVSITSGAGNFQADETVNVGPNTTTTSATAVVYYANTTQLWLTNVQGSISTSQSIRGVTSGASAVTSTVVPADLIYASGDVVYVDNFSPINRTTGQTETAKIIIEF